MSTAAELTELLTAIRDFLDLPESAPGHYDDKARLRSYRGLFVSGVLESVLDGSASAASAVERLALGAESDAAIDYPVAPALATAPDHSDDCVAPLRICGPGCCSPVLGVHGSCPGPHVGATVVSTR